MMSDPASQPMKHKGAGRSTPARDSPYLELAAPFLLSSTLSANEGGKEKRRTVRTETTLRHMHISRP